LKIVEIEWLDACMDDASVLLSVAKTLKPIRRHNVGYLLEENNVEVVIAFGDLDNLCKGETAYHQSFAIPHGCITKIKSLT